jgi:hypothetical protein
MVRRDSHGSPPGEGMGVGTEEWETNAQHGTANAQLQHSFDVWIACNRTNPCTSPRPGFRLDRSVGPKAGPGRGPEPNLSRYAV